MDPLREGFGMVRFLIVVVLDDESKSPHYVSASPNTKKEPEMCILDLNSLVYGLDATDAKPEQSPAPGSDRLPDDDGDVHRLIAALKKQNRELASEVMERSKLIASLNNVSPLPLEGITLDKVLSTILNNVLNCFGYYRGVVYLWDKKKENLSCYGTAGMSRASERIVRSRPLNICRHDCIEIRAAQSSTYTYVENPSEGPELTRHDLKISHQHGGRGSVLYVPLRSKGETFGIIGIERFPVRAERYPGQFRITEKDIKVLMLFVNHASIAIENARLYEQNQRKIDYLFKLQEIHHELNSMVDMDHLIEKILEGALIVSGATSGILWKYNSGPLRVEASVSRGYSNLPGSGVHASLKVFPFDELFRKQRAVRIPDLEESGVSLPLSQSKGSAVFLPIVYKDRIAAIIQLDHSEHSAFDDTATEVLKIYASQASKLIENMTLYNTLLLEKRFTDNLRKSIAVGILITDAEGKIRSINPRAKEICKITSSNLSRKPVRSIFVKDKSFISDIIYETIHTNRDIETEVTYNSGSEALILEVSAFVVYDEENKLCGVTTFISDITEKKRMRDSLNRMERTAAIGTMAAGVAHELRNPLSGIYAAIQTLVQELALTDEQREIMDAVLGEADRMETLIHEILQISKPINLNMVKVDMNDVLRNSVTAMRETIREKSITIVEQFEPRLPAIHADPDKLRQVFLNLLLNAVQATSDGGAIELFTRSMNGKAQEGRSGVEIRVLDYGSGVSTEHLSKIFDPFFTTKNRGTGLGLTICQKIIEEHDGEIFVQSESGQGSIFCVRLKK